MVIDVNYWTKVIRRSLALLFSVLLVYLGFKLAVFFLPFLIAFLIALFIEPAIRFFMKKMKLKRKISAILVFVLAFAVITGLIVWGITTLISETSNLLASLNDYISKADQLLQNIFQSFDFNKLQLSEQVSQTIQSSAMDFLGTLSNWIKNALTKVMNGITALPTIGFYIVITFLSLYFICTDKIYMLDQLEHHLPETWVKRIGIHIRDLVKTLGCYLKAQAILILISFVISLIRIIFI